MEVINDSLSLEKDKRKWTRRFYPRTILNTISNKPWESIIHEGSVLGSLSERKTLYNKNKTKQKKDNWGE